MKKEDLYDINSYSEKELYEILDLDDPSDRELEAKILMMIHKYKNMDSNSSKKLAYFFESIYDHFFQTNDDDVDNSEETVKPMIEGLSNMQNANIDISKQDKPTELVKRNQEYAEEEPTDKDNVLYTTNLEYAKGGLNPLLKQTTKRIISIDSQYRPNKTTFSTEFTFNLSEPLKDVVSLKLYSIQIPYTWYTIGKSYGSNFFYFKGKTEGLTDGVHEIQIKIDSGNYKPQELIDTVNVSIQSKNSEIDANISDTNVVYNSYTSLSRFNIDITKKFNESSYYLSFPTWESPYQSDSSRNLTIPSYLGFQTDIYYGNVLKSPLYYSLENTSFTSDSNATFAIDSTNNFFTIIQYNDSFPYTTSSSTIDVSETIRFSLSNGTYTRKELIADLNEQLLANANLYESYIERKNIDSANNEFDTLVSYVEMRLKFNRLVCNTNTDNKIVVIFPESDNIWYGETSCFRFDASYNELNEIYSEVASIAQSDRYIIESLPYVELKCTLDGFVNVLNDVSFSIPNSNEEGYSITEYVEAINRSIREYDTSFNEINGYSVLNAPSESYEYDSAVNDYPTGTYAYISSNAFNMYIDINKTFDESMYEIDLTDSIFKTTIPLTYSNGDDLVSDILSDLTDTYSATINAGGINVSEGDIICTIKPKTDTNNGNEGDETYILTFDTATNYTNYPLLQEDINNIFANYIDKNTNLNIFSGTKLSSTVSNNVYNVAFNISIVKKLITKNYSIQYVDAEKNSWVNNLYIDTSISDSEFNMDFEIPASGSSDIYNADEEKIAEINASGKILINAVDNIAISNTLTIEAGINDTFTFNAFEDGVYSEGGANNITITIPPGIYSTDYLITTANEQIQLTETLSNAKNTILSIVKRNDEQNYVKISTNIIRSYDANDYNLVFYDSVSFSQCVVGGKSVQNTTWDTTIGWIMGFREYTSYDLSAFYDSSTESISIDGDTGISTSLFNYFLLCLDDFNQNHLNDGLVTITGSETNIPLPSYANRTGFQCDPVTGEKVYNNTLGLTEKQIYAANEIANSANNTDSIGSSVSTKSYGTGPYVTDVFGLIPVKTSGLSNGAPYVEFGGTLQNQERMYFGPVNIQRMSVKLVSDRGNLVDLNNANWSFSLICEQLNKLEPTS